MTTYTIKRSKTCTKDGLYVRDLSEIPQRGYIVLKNTFAKTEQEVCKQVADILRTHDYILKFVY